LSVQTIDLLSVQTADLVSVQTTDLLSVDLLSVQTTDLLSVQTTDLLSVQTADLLSVQTTDLLYVETTDLARMRSQIGQIGHYQIGPDWLICQIARLVSPDWARLAFHYPHIHISYDMVQLCVLMYASMRTTIFSEWLAPIVVGSNPCMRGFFGTM